MENQRLFIWALFGLMAFMTWTTWQQDYAPRPEPADPSSQQAAERPPPADTPDADLPDVGDVPTMDFQPGSDLLAVGSRDGVRDLVGATGLRQLAALLSRARAFVGCDTGPMHLAAASGAPVVALFGPADPRRTGPWGEGHRVVRVPPPCAPCNRRTCDRPRHACMEDIDVERVLAEVRAVAASGTPVG